MAYRQFYDGLPGILKGFGMERGDWSARLANLLDHPYHDYFNQDTSLVRDTRRFDRAVGLALHYKY